MPELQRLEAGHAPAVLAFERANRAWFAASISDRGDEFFTQASAGMPGVARIRKWREAIANKPANRDLILAQDTAQFLATMQSWIDHFIPQPQSPVPGMEPDDFGRLTMPVTPSSIASAIVPTVQARLSLSGKRCPDTPTHGCGLIVPPDSRDAVAAGQPLLCCGPDLWSGL